MQINTPSSNRRIVSGMRTTGALHLGHYHGVLKNWITLQHEYDCFFFAADWHALTTHYNESDAVKAHTEHLIIDWLAAGVNPSSATIFIQSRIPEHAELHLLLSMITPLGWLERIPTYKDQQEKLKDRDLGTYGFLGYPLLQAADILLYKPGFVPVGEDQVSHIEFTREVARRFNHIYGRDKNFEALAEEAIVKLGKKNAKHYRELLKQYQELGDKEALEKGHALLDSQQNTSVSDKERLYGYLEGGGKIILSEPQALLTDIAKMPGLDGQKMSKSYGNTIGLREAPAHVAQKIEKMPTDPARVRKTDPGEPEKCPVWSFHKIYSADSVKEWVQQGCRRASIGCLDCKKPLIEAIQREQAPIIERGREYESNPKLVRSLITEGCESARTVAQQTLEEVYEVVGL